MDLQQDSQIETVGEIEKGLEPINQEDWLTRKAFWIRSSSLSKLLI